MHLCIFLLEARFNQFSAQNVSFEVFFRNIIRAARFCRRCNSLQHPSEIPSHATSAQSNNGCKSEVYTCLEASSVRHDRIRDKSPSLLLTLLLTYSTGSFQERFSSKPTPKKLNLTTLFKVFPYKCIQKFRDLARFCQLPKSIDFVLL